MKKNREVLLFICLVTIIFSACDRRKITRTDTEISGTATIACDECFVPIMREQIDVFTGLNPEAEIKIIYSGEKEVIDLLLKDSVRLIMAARELNAQERATIESKRLSIRSQRIARDGIALITNRVNMDSIISVNVLKKIMMGGISSWSEISTCNSDLGNIKVVFDHPNSSTLRFIYESITQGEDLSSEIKALDSNLEVIDFVSRTPNALGVIGVNWISNPHDSTKLSFIEGIRVMAVGTGDEISRENVYRPYPAYLNSGDYPLTRDVFLILTDLRGTLPAGFVKFMAGDAGQRIILKAGLVPATRPTREILLRENF